MRGPRATMSGDGVLRVDLRLSARVSRFDLAGLLIRATAPYHSSDDELVELSAAEAERRIRREAVQYGTERGGWTDHMEQEEQDAWLEWAFRQVERVYPTLAEGESGG